MAVKVLTFDLDDTLWDAPEVLERARRAQCEWLRRRYPGLLALAGRGAAPRWMRCQCQSPEAGAPCELLGQRMRDLCLRQPGYRHRISALRIQAARELLVEAGCGAAEALDSAEMSFRMFMARRRQVGPAMFAETWPALPKLARKYRIGALTNGNADVRKMPMVRCFRHFDFAFHAEDLSEDEDRAGNETNDGGEPPPGLFSAGGGDGGHARRPVNGCKPLPGLFRAALRHTGVAKHELAYVGNCPENDVGGARNAGVLSIWFNRHNAKWPGGPKPNAEVASLLELVNPSKKLKELLG